MISPLNVITPLLPQLLLANEGSHFSWWGIIWSFVNLSIIIAIIWIFAGKTIKTMFINRHNKISGDINEAQKALESAQKSHQAAEANLSGLDDTIADYHNRLTEELTAIKKDGELQAAELQASLQHHLDEQLASEKALITQRLMNSLVDKIVDEAKENLVTAATVADHNQRLDDLLAALDGQTGTEVIKTIHGDYQ